MNLEENETNDRRYVTKKMLAITITLIILVVVIAYAIIVMYFNNKIQDVVDEMESQDSLTLVQNDDWVNNVIVE